MQAAPYFNYWGKADPAYPGEPKWHPFAFHCLDVAAVATVWWDGSPVIRQRFQAAFCNAEAEALRAWTVFFVALHDLGKLDVRFQMKSSRTVGEAWPELEPSRDLVRAQAEAEKFDHGRWGNSWAVQECLAWVGERDDCRHRAWQPWLQAVMGHHGEYPIGVDRPGRFAAKEVLEHDLSARADWVRLAAAMFLAPAELGLTDMPPETNDAAKALLAGFCSVCDWIGSNTEVSPYVACRPDQSLTDYFHQRVDAIRCGRWLKRFGLVNAAMGYGGLARLLKAAESPRGVQVRVDDLPCAPGLILVEAPTGSGKTEAALAQAWRLLEGGVAESIVFALPTQATANAMLSRAEAFSVRVWPEGANVVLAHGKRRLSEAFQHLVDTARIRTAQGRTEAGAQCAGWLASSRKRVFLGQLGVGTVDQVLLSVLPVRHKFVRGFGLARSVLIVDEVHAYDAYMHGLLAEVLRRQKAAGGCAILLSATLPAGMREKLFAAWGMSGPIEADYPVIWWGNHGEARPIEVPEDQRPDPREVAIECPRLPGAEPDVPMLQRIASAAQSGARVAVVCNLVDVSQRVARRLREITACPVDIFHARYRFADRREKETAVLERYGRHADRAGGRILVATQVVEQSLDLDFDWMVTQICPVDLLFQRLGRLHRHRRPHGERPAEFTAPRCSVLTVEGDDYGLHKLIYGNTRVLWRTQRLLEGVDRIVFPSAYREWIESVYAGTIWDDEPDIVYADFLAWKDEQERLETEARGMVTGTRGMLKLFGDDDEGIAIKTRDGEMSLSILALRDDGRLLDGTDPRGDQGSAHLMNLEFNTIPVPASWGKSLKGCEQDEDGRHLAVFVRQDAGVWSARAGNASFVYTEDFGLEKLNGREATLEIDKEAAP